MKIAFLLLLLIRVRYIFAQDEDSILCSEAFCNNYIQENPCPDLPDNCKIQNSTHSGIEVPYPEACNCCPSCLVNQDEGQDCSSGGPGTGVPEVICGPGLTCNNGICEKITNTPCTRAQGEYDSKVFDGTIGSLEMRPECDGDGDYVPYRCIPGQTCFCVDKQGNRIFGEVPFTKTPQYILKCPCPRKYHAAVDLVGKELLPGQFFRCTSAGDYDRIQCIEDECFCVDSGDGALTYPNLPSVPIDDISNKTLDCFEKGVHVENGYYYECAERYVEVLKEIQKSKDDDGYSDVFMFDVPNCDLDGRYAPVQKNSSFAYCADPEGKPIENFFAPLDEIDKMNCKCARTRTFLVDEIEKPECEENGNFKKIQCRRGYCRCVDSDGYQIKQEVEEDHIDEIDCALVPSSTN